MCVRKKRVFESKCDVCRSKHSSGKNARIFTRFHFAVNEKSTQKTKLKSKIALLSSGSVHKHHWEIYSSLWRAKFICLFFSSEKSGGESQARAKDLNARWGKFIDSRAVFLVSCNFSIASSVNLSILHSPSGILSSLHVHRERKKKQFHNNSTSKVSRLWWSTKISAENDSFRWMPCFDLCLQLQLFCLLLQFNRREFLSCFHPTPPAVKLESA